ncbi:MAG: CapA family protein [Syntrophobacteraceae bacterium]|jgi:poly-gamma-glutamate synthesis protein (capsule biosynthesis protein)
MSTERSVLNLLSIFTVVWLILVPLSHGTSDGGEKSEVRLLFAGDILLSRGVERRLLHNPQALSRALQSMLSGFDWAAGNLEGAVGSSDSCLKSAQETCFSIRDEFIPLLSQAGFKAIGLANNHSSDLGRTGLETSRRLIAQNGMTALTYEDSPQFINFDNLTVGLITLSMIPGRDKEAVDVPGIDLRQKLRLAKNLSNLVVVYIHWGSEFLDWPDKRQRRAAKWLIKHGADIIVGHHPHVVQKPECINGRPIFYSLGNLVFDQKYSSTKEGLLADCRIRGETVSCSGIRTRTAESSTLPAVNGVDSEVERELSGCGLKLAPCLMVRGITLRPEGNSAQGGRQPGLLLKANREGKVLWKTRHAKIVSIESMKVGGPQPAEYLFTLERHYSEMDKEEGLRPCVYEVRPEALIPKWKGTGLAWPLLDAALLPGDSGVLCAEHRGDSFIRLEPGSPERRIAAYRWKGFGFSGIHDPQLIDRCREYLE